MLCTCNSRFISSGYRSNEEVRNFIKKNLIQSEQVAAGKMMKGNDHNELSILDDTGAATEAEPKSAADNKSDIDVVDAILSDLGGTFQRYQILNYILFCIPFALSGTFALNYVFTALNLEYR